MRTANVFMSAIHLLITMLIFAIGFFFVTLYFYPNILFYFVNHIIDKPQVILKLGFFTLLLALVLFSIFYIINKAQYVKFTMEKNKFHIDSKLIKTYIEKYLESTFPDKKSKFEICVLPKEKLEIIATVDCLDDQKEFLLNIEKKIGELLLKQLNYQKDFIFTLKSKK